MSARSVAFKEWISAIHWYRKLRQVGLGLGIALRIGQGPSRGDNGVEADVADLVVLDLVHVTIDHIHLIKGLEQFLDLLGVLRPKIPPPVDLL